MKSIVSELHKLFVEQNLEDTDYILKIRAVIDGTDKYIQNNREIVNDPETLKQVIYEFAKKLWLNHLEKSTNLSSEASSTQSSSENNGYYEYYYDYIYNHSVYPR